MTYTKYLDIPNRREPLGGRDHIQHMETSLSRVVPGPGEVIVGGADGPVAVHRALVPLALRDDTPLVAPTVMENPPIVTLGEPGGGAPVPSSQAAMAANDPIIRYSRSLPILASTNVYAGGMADGGRPPLMAEVMFDGAELGFRTTGQGGRYRFRVDGELVSESWSDPLPKDNQGYWWKLDFGSRATRRIAIEGEGTVTFRTLAWNAKDSVWPVAEPRGPRVIVLGDSWARENTDVVLWSDTYPFIMGDLLGWSDVWASGVGGAGYLNGPSNYRGRVHSDVISHNPDVVIVTGGTNDHAYSIAETEAAAGELYDTIRASLPNALLLVAEPFYKGTPEAQSLLDTRTAIQAAAGARGIPYLPTKGVFTGTGQVEAQTTSGNANYYVTGNHPTTAGQRHIGHWLAAQVARYARELVR